MPNPSINSPEQLNDYIKVTSPGAWLILSAILVFLAGFFFWIFTGQLEVSFSSYVFTEGGNSQAFVDVNEAAKLKQGMTVRLADTGTSGTVEKVEPKILSFSEIANLIGENNSISMGIGNEARLMKVALKFADAPEKISRAIFVTDKVNPVSFLLK